MQQDKNSNSILVVDTKYKNIDPLILTIPTISGARSTFGHICEYTRKKRNQTAILPQTQACVICNTHRRYYSIVIHNQASRI